MKTLQINQEEKVLYNENERIEYHTEFGQKHPDAKATMDRWIAEMKAKKTGDTHVISYDAGFSFGNVEYLITRKDQDGNVYGTYSSGNIYEFDEEDVI